MKMRVTVMCERPPVIDQGKIVIDGDGYGFQIMYPDGMVEGAADRKSAQRKASRWFKKNCPKDRVGFGSIEWREFR